MTIEKTVAFLLFSFSLVPHSQSSTYRDTPMTDLFFAEEVDKELLSILLFIYYYCYYYSVLPDLILQYNGMVIKCMNNI